MPRRAREGRATMDSVRTQGCNVVDDARVRRLSASAISLLVRLCPAHTAITYSMASGTFSLTVDGDALGRVPARTVEALAMPRLITKDTHTNGHGPCYVITDRGRDALRQRARDLCAAKGKDCTFCTKSECMFEGGE